jgi:hypothetical protein
MSRVDKRALAVVLIVVTVVFPFRAWWDLRHPENWMPGSGDDPHVYLWLWGATGVFIAWVAWRIVLMERQSQRRARLKTLLMRAESLVRQHRQDEARAVLEECEVLLAKVKSS